MQETRTKKSIYNFITAIGAQMLTIVMSFICRTVFIATLGKTYLGLNGLFTNILTMLSLTELGIGTAITFYMYEPLARNDVKRIVILLDFYKKVYRIIAVIIATIGVCLIPFLPVLVKGYDKLERAGLNAVIIYLLYLLQSVSTYLFFAYRTVIIKADQKEYVLNVVKYAVIIATNVTQIISLYLFRDFTIYIIIMVAFTIIENLIYARIVEKRYPYITQKPEGSLTKTEIRNIFKDTGAVFLYKLNRVVLKSTDNIVLSAFLGLDAVALYSNYYIFYLTINGLYLKINNALIHSIGNLHTTHREDREFLVFKSMIMIMTIIGGTVMVGISVVADEFITVWIGKDWTIPHPFSLLLGIELFILCVQYFMSKYRNALGLFQQLKALPIVGALVNLVTSIILVQYMDISGVVLGTIIAESMVFMVIDPFVIYRYGFKGHHKLSGFYLQLAKQIVAIVISLMIARYLCGKIVLNKGWISVAVHIVICGAITPTLMLLFNCRNEEMDHLTKIVKRRLGKKHTT